MPAFARILWNRAVSQQSNQSVARQRMVADYEALAGAGSIRGAGDRQHLAESIGLRSLDTGLEMLEY